MLNEKNNEGFSGANIFEGTYRNVCVHVSSGGSTSIYDNAARLGIFARLGSADIFDWFIIHEHEHPKVFKAVLAIVEDEEKNDVDKARDVLVCCLGSIRINPDNIINLIEEVYASGKRAGRTEIREEFVRLLGLTGQSTYFIGDDYDD